MNKQELLRTLEQTHDQLLEAINWVPDEEKTTRKVSGEWTAKDLLAHVTRWENVCAGYLAQVAAGEPIPLLDATTDELNARWSAEDRSLTLDEVWRNSDTSALRVRAMVESVVDSLLETPMRGPWVGVSEELPLERIIAIDTWDHYQQHLKDLDGSVKA